MSTQIPPSAVEILEITTSDVFERVTEVILAASHDPLISHFGALHPTTGCTLADGEAGIKAESVRKWAEHERNPYSRWIAAVDTTSD